MTDNKPNFWNIKSIQFVTDGATIEFEDGRQIRWMGLLSHTLKQMVSEFIESEYHLMNRRLDEKG